MAQPANSQTVNVAEKIIDLFGGLQRAADITGIRYSQLRSWKRHNITIPEEQRAVILAAAKANDIAITPWTFIEHLLEFSV